MIDTTELRRLAEAAQQAGWLEHIYVKNEAVGAFVVAANPAEIIELLDEIERLRGCLKKANSQSEQFERELALTAEAERQKARAELHGESCNLLRAKIEQMGRQEPIATKRKNGLILHTGWDALSEGAKLYAAPGAKEKE